MTARLALSAFIVLVYVASCTAIEEKRHFESFDPGTGKSMPYSYILPDGYDTNKAYPVVLGLGSDDPPGGPSFFFRREGLSKHGWIIVESDAYFSSDPIEASRKLMTHLRTKFKVEGDRFYTLCYSSSSSRIFNVVLSLPEFYQGLIAVPGHPTSTDKATLSKLKNVKIRFLVGGNDGYWLRKAQSAHKRMKELGIEATIEIFPGKDHVLKELIGDGMMEQFKKMRTSH